MDAQYSASATVRSHCDELPLITCTDCGRTKVVKRRSTKDWSLGKIFYCCPYHKRNAGCPFFYQEDEYLQFILERKKEGKLAPEDDIFSGFDGVKEERVEQLKRTDVVSCLDEKELVQMLREVARLGNELVRMVKAILLVSVCIMFLQLLSLVAHMCNHEI